MNWMRTGPPGRDHGAAAVEFALVVPLLLLLVFGTVEFGRAYNAQITLQHAVREGVRHFAIHQDEDEAIDKTVEAATSIVLDPANVEVGDCNPGEPTAVRATYDFPLVVFDFGTNPTLKAEGFMRCGG